MHTAWGEIGRRGSERDGEREREKGRERVIRINVLETRVRTDSNINYNWGGGEKRKKERENGSRKKETKRTDNRTLITIRISRHEFMRVKKKLEHQTNKTRENK